MTVTNKDRAEWAAAALKHFETLTGTDHAGGLAELLCDLMHFADAYTFDFPDALDRARANYDQEFFEETKPTIPETIPYMAYFRTTAGPANDIYQAETPDQALRIAQEIFDRDDESLGFTPGDCPELQEIRIATEDAVEVLIWQTDEYRLQLAAPKLLQALEEKIEIIKEIIDAWNNYDGPRPIVEELIEALQRQSQDASAALDACEIDDLSAVSDLQETIAPALELIAQAKGGAA